MLMNPDITNLSSSAYSKNLPNSFSFSYHGRNKIQNVIKETFLCKIEKRIREVSVDEAATERVQGKGKGEIVNEVCSERVPCVYCKRLFVKERIEKHQQVCENSFKKQGTTKKTSPKPVKTGILEFHYPLSKWQKQHNELINKLRENEYSEEYEEYITCPYCSRRFAPGPAEKHVNKCKDIIHKPKPPPNKVLPELKKRNYSFIKDRHTSEHSGKGSPREGGMTERVVGEESFGQENSAYAGKKVKVKHLTEPRSKSIYKMNQCVCKCGEMLPARAVYCMMCGMCRYK